MDGNYYLAANKPSPPGLTRYILLILALLGFVGMPSAHPAGNHALQSFALSYQPMNFGRRRARSSRSRTRRRTTRCWAPRSRSSAGPTRCGARPSRRISTVSWPSTAATGFSATRSTWRSPTWVTSRSKNATETPDSGDGSRSKWRSTNSRSRRSWSSGSRSPWSSGATRRSTTRGRSKPWPTTVSRSC